MVLQFLLFCMLLVTTSCQLGRCKHVIQLYKGLSLLIWIYRYMVL